MAAIGTVLELLDSGSHVVAMNDLYGGSYRILERVRKRSANLGATFTDLQIRKIFENNLKPEYADGVGREPTNPLLKIVDLEAVAAIARRHKLISVCDNTFASPWIQRPLELGFDIVVHSTTKYLNGHSDVIGGAAVFRDETWKENWRSFKTPSAACRVRSTPSSRCAASRRSRCAWSGIAATRCTSPRGSKSIPRSRGSSIPALRAIRSTRWPRAR